MKNSPNWAALIVGAGLLAILLTFTIFRKCSQPKIAVPEMTEDSVQLLYGIDPTPYAIDEKEIGSGQTLGQILNGYGISAVAIDKLARVCDSIFPLRNIRAGHTFTTFQTPDSIARLDYFVYEISVTKYMVIDLTQDPPAVRLDEKEVTPLRLQRTATITSSLWNSMIDNGMSPVLAAELSDIYAWSIDFFAVQKDDRYTVIYDQLYVDSLIVGVGAIWGSSFEHGGKTYYAIPFIQDGKLRYWDQDGNSLRKNLLKAPLNYSRISSRFSNSRMHPVLRIRRPHHGVDYAAPAGTPVVAVGDGVVVFKGWSGGGGNTLKIKHTSGSLVSGYLHLRGYAKGINVGTRVSQGQSIGYVGSTGVSTGPHLDFRLWQNNRPIDPLKVPTEPAEPIQKENRTAFEAIRDRVMAELAGPVPDSVRITRADLEPVSDTTSVAAPPASPPTPAMP